METEANQSECMAVRLDVAVREELAAIDAHIVQVQNIVEDAVTKLSNGFERLSRGSLDQQALLESTLSAVVNKSTGSVTIAVFTDKSQALMDHVLGGIQCANQRTLQLAEQLESTTKGLERLNGLAEDMCSVSEQIRFLALNATIEAGRAGAAGRGFAVVAGAVKELSSQFRGISDNMAATVSDVRGSIQDVSSQAATAAQRDGSFIEHTRADVATLVDDASSLNQALADNLSSAQGIGMAVQEGLHLGIAGLQFGDLVAQIGAIASERVQTLGPIVESAVRIACSDAAMQNVADQFMTLKSSIRPGSVPQTSLESGDVELF